MDTHPKHSTTIEFSNPIARDLWWVLASAPILMNVPQLPQHTDPERRSMCSALLPFIQDVERMSLDEAVKVVGVQGWRVGLYFESLVAALIDAHSQWTLVGKEVQIRGQGRTLGAFDFIVRTETGTHEHWEVAVKFYLHYGSSQQWPHWLGPNQRDRLDKKINRMRHHQLPLSRRTEAQDALQTIGVSSIDRHLALVKGILFTQWGSKPMAPPHGYQAPVGRWVSESQVSVVNRTFSQDAWVRREKPFWLAPIRAEGADVVCDGLPKRVSRPEMWARLVRAGTGWCEVERWFVVPERWKDWRGVP